MKLPQKYIHPAVIAKLLALGYAVDGLNTYPRVEVHSFDTTPTGDKGNKQHDVTFIIEVIDNDTDLARSIDIMERIRTNIDVTLTISGVRIIYIVWELLQTFEELTETDLTIQRQLQRVRFTIEEI
jgi:hypothetical protein